jgi:hypothetical protein
MQRMGWTLPFTLGNLHLLWWWALDFAPTGDLSRFEPDQITADLDLGGATPEQFIEAMVAAGFLDRLEDGTLCIHDWVDYTSKSSRSKSRKSVSSLGSNEASSTVSEPASSCALRSDQMVGKALRAVRRMTSPGPVNDTAQSDFTPDATTHNDDAPSVAKTAERDAAPPLFLTEIPRVLDALPSFTDLWWSRLLDIYNIHGDPLSADDQRQLLGRLATNPFTAIQKLKDAYENAERGRGRIALLNTS